MSRRSSLSGLLLALVLVPRVAAGEAKLRCLGGTCDFLLSGGTGAVPKVVLQPSEADAREGRIVLNGFTELFPDWRPPEKAGVEKIFSWSPTATLVDGTSLRAFDFAPDVTVRDVTRSSVFSVTGKLTRTGNDNPLYQWTGFYTGTHFRSAASAICIGGAKARAACTGDADCPGSICEGGSPLYQDSFFDGSIGDQLRGHAIQHTWIPISFLSKTQLRASRTCAGGSNPDAYCLKDAQCLGGGVCEAAYLEQDESYALFVQPSFQEFEGATLINHDFAAVVLDDPYVAGSPQVDRYTALLCDPNATGWKTLPAETKRYCVASLSPQIKSRHAGPFRIGDTVEPQEALEVNGTIALDGGSAGTAAARRGVWFRNAGEPGAQQSAVALDVEDQTVGSYAAALRSSIAKGRGKWNLALTGTADSTIAGSVVLGVGEGVTPEARLHVHEPSPGAEVVRLESGGAGGPSLRTFQRETQTSGADAVTLHAFTPEPGHSYVVEARVIARCRPGAGCDGESAAYVRRILVREAGGVAKCVTGTVGAGEFAASEVREWDASLVCTGGELQLRVKGDAGRSVLWQDTMVVQGVGS
ncbi:hypothetical protein K2Z84_09795 [Candidatus Binatia bacterium]|nr:hypothetical protein [Candidatus Binatia bacterium]